MTSSHTSIPTVLVTGSTSSGKSSFANTLRHLTSTKRRAPDPEQRASIHVVECRDDQVENWVRRNKARRHILCIYLLKPSDFPLLQPPTTAFDTLLRLRALARPDSPPYSPQTTSNQVHKGHHSSQARRRSGTLIVLPVLSKADCYTINGLERAKEECLETFRDDWEPDVSWDWGFVPARRGSSATSTGDEEVPRREEVQRPSRSEQPQKKEEELLLWSVINPDWSEPSLQSMIKVPTMDLRLLSTALPSRTDNPLPGTVDVPSIREASSATASISVQNASASTSMAHATTTETSLDCLASVAASLPSPPNEKLLATPNASNEAHIRPSSSSRNGKEVAVKHDDGSSIHEASGAATRSTSTQSTITPPSGDVEMADALAEGSQQPSENYQEAYELFARDYPWGRCYPLKPTHSDLAKVVRWTEAKIDELSKEPMLGSENGDASTKPVETDVMNIDRIEDPPHVHEHDSDEDLCPHSPCMLSTCSGDHHGPGFKPDERVPHLHRSASDSVYEQGRVRNWARQQPKPALAPSSLKGKEVANEKAELTAFGSTLIYSDQNHGQAQAQGPGPHKTLLLRTSSAPITALPLSVASQSPAPPTSTCRPGPSSSNPNRQSRTPHPLSLEPVDLPDGPPPPPLLSPSGRRWPGAPTSTTGLADDSYPNSHPRQGFRQEVMDTSADWRFRVKMAQVQQSQDSQAQHELKVECEESNPATLSDATLANGSTDNALQQIRDSPSGASASSGYSHTLPPPNRVIALDPAIPGEGVRASTSSSSSNHGHPGLASIGISNSNTSTSLSTSAGVPVSLPSHSPSKPPKPRKPKAQLACTFCRTRKLRCAPSAGQSKFCGECEKRGIVCEGPSERETRRRREIEEAAARAADAPAAAPAPGTDPASGSSAPSSKEVSSGGKAPLGHAVPPKMAGGDQAHYITGQLTDLGVIPQQEEVTEVRREAISGDRDGDGHRDVVARDGGRTLGLGLDTMNPTAAKGNGNSLQARALRVVSLEHNAPGRRDDIPGPPHQYHQHYVPSVAPVHPSTQSTYSSRQQPPSFFPPIQPKQMSQSDREGSPRPPHSRRHSYEDENRRYYTPPSRDRPPSQGYGSDRELHPPGPPQGYYGPPPPSSEAHRGEFYPHPHPSTSRYRRESSQPPRRHSEYRRTLPSPPPGPPHNQSASLSHYPSHHYSQHPPAVPSQNTPPGSLHVPYGHPSSHQQGPMSHGRPHSHSHPRPYMPPLTVPHHAMTSAHPPTELLPSHLPPPPGPYGHMGHGQGRPHPGDEYSSSLSIATMNRISRRAKEEAKVKNPSSRSGPKVVACNHCRARKTRCDGETPCSNCQKRNLNCQYQLSAREAARRRRAQAADFASRTRGAHSSTPNIPDSPRSIAPTLQASPAASRVSSVEPPESGGMGGGSPASMPFTQSYRHGASLSPVLHRPQQHPSASIPRDIHLAPVSTHPASQSPRMALPPITSLTSPGPRTISALPESLHSGMETLKRPRSPAQEEDDEGSSSNPPAAETSQSQSKRMRVDALID